MKTSAKKRKYELRKRADAMAATRQRITEAAVGLHGSVGPARTTISAVAERAGVQRHTVYRHFANERELYAACSGHFVATHPQPDPAAWRAIGDPAQRLDAGLDALYAYYEDTEAMYVNVLRDAALVPALDEALAPFRAFQEEAAATLADGWPVRGESHGMVAAAVGHVVDFATWRSLARDGAVTRPQAVALAAAMVRAAAKS